MKTIALCLFALLAVGTGCASTASAEDADTSEGAMETNTFGDETPGAKEAVKLLSARPASSMTIAASTGYSSWRFDMSTNGFTVTGLDADGHDGTKIAYAMDLSGPQPKLIGIAVDYARIKPDGVRGFMVQIKKDLEAARAAIPEIDEPAMPSDPSAWKPTDPDHCSQGTDELVAAVLSAAAAVALAGTGLTALGGGAVGIWGIAGGGLVMVVGDAAYSLICDEPSELWSPSGSVKHRD